MTKKIQTAAIEGGKKMLMEHLKNLATGFAIFLVILVLPVTLIMLAVYHLPAVAFAFFVIVGVIAFGSLFYEAGKDFRGVR